MLLESVHCIGTHENIIFKYFRSYDTDYANKINDYLEKYKIENFLKIDIKQEKTADYFFYFYSFVGGNFLPSWSIG